MANTIAKAIGSDNSRDKTVHRLGSVSSEGQANTYKTFVTAYVEADGSGYVRVMRGGACLHHFEFGAENV